MAKAGTAVLLLASLCWLLRASSMLLSLCPFCTGGLWGSGLSHPLFSFLTLFLEMIILICGFCCHLSSIFYIQIILLPSRLTWPAAQQTSPGLLHSKGSFPFGKGGV